MPRADQGGRKATGVRADGTPRRAAHSDAPRRASRADTGTGASGSGRGSRTETPPTGRPGRTPGIPASRTSRADASAERKSRTSDADAGGRRTGAASGPARTSTASGSARSGAASGSGRTGAASGSARTGGVSGSGRTGAASGSARTGAGIRTAPPSVTRRSDPRPPVKRASDTAPTDGPERLQKLLAAAGVGSRRACEELILAGRVTVDGKRAELGDRADPRTAAIHVDGERIVADGTRLYLAINKPAGVVTTMADEKGRAALADYLGNVAQRVYHVGRLDKDSEGLLLLTNDGTLAHKLMHPSYRVLKTYLAEVPGPVRPGLKRKLLGGVELEDGTVTVDAFRVVDTSGGRALVEIVLHEGRKHVVRRLLAEVGHPVSRLVRTQIGPVKLGDLRSGRNRRLTPAEVADLFRAVGD